MNELAIFENEEQMSMAIDAIELYQMQIRSMEEEIDRIKSSILTAMQKHGVGVVDVLEHRFNRIVPTKKKLMEKEATNWLIEKDLLRDYMTLDTKKVTTSFPQFVEETLGTEYLKISKRGEK
jgi:FtsZ-binding cell division protein ZapB